MSNDTFKIVKDLYVVEPCGSSDWCGLHWAMDSLLSDRIHVLDMTPREWIGMRRDDFRFASDKGVPRGTVVLKCIDNEKEEDRLTVGSYYVGLVGEDEWKKLRREDEGTVFILINDQHLMSEHFVDRFIDVTKDFIESSIREAAKNKVPTVGSFVVVCVDNVGIEDRFDVGGEYEATVAPSDPEMLVVKNKDGVRDEYFRDRFKIVSGSKKPSDRVSIEDFDKIISLISKTPLAATSPWSALLEDKDGSMMTKMLNDWAEENINKEEE